MFVAVAEEQNFTRAAERLHISQPAVTQHIQNLERAWGVELFDRSRRKVHLNRAGEVVLSHAREILSLYRSLDRQLDELKQSVSGALSIGASLTFGEYVLPHLIARFRQEYPEVDATVEIENTAAVVEKVRLGEVDIGVIEGSYRGDDVIVEPFAEDRVIVVAADELYRDLALPASSEALSRLTWMIREQGSGTREITDRVMQWYGLHPAKVVEYASTQVIKESVEAGLGIAILSRWVVRREIAWGILREVPLQPPNGAFTHARPADGEPARDVTSRRFSVVRRNSSFHPKVVHVFREFLFAVGHQLNQFEV